MTGTAISELIAGIITSGGGPARRYELKIRVFLDITLSRGNAIFRNSSRYPSPSGNYRERSFLGKLPLGSPQLLFIFAQARKGRKWRCLMLRVSNSFVRNSSVVFPRSRFALTSGNGAPFLPAVRGEVFPLAKLRSALNSRSSARKSSLKVNKATSILNAA